jgi:hypothetical protein
MKTKFTKDDIMSKRNVVHIEIPAADQVKAAKFYETLFGWKTTRDEKLDYTLWEPPERVRAVDFLRWENRSNPGMC